MLCITFFVLTNNNKGENIMKRKALAILIKEIIKRNLAIILTFSPSIIGFIVTLVIGMINGYDIDATIFIAIFIAVMCFFAYSLIICVIDTFLQWKKEYNNILIKLKEENK